MLKCPLCETGLKIVKRHGVEIDFCSHCRGAWLDSRELDEIAEHARNQEREKNCDYYRQSKQCNHETGQLENGELPQERYSRSSGESHFGDELYYDSILRRNRIWR